MRHRSPTNTRPWEDKESYWEYVAEHDLCQLYSWFPGRFRDKQPGPGAHHIFGGNGGRWDLRANLICLSQSAHDEVHRVPVIGRVLCLFVKLMEKQLLRKFRDTDALEIDVACKGLSHLERDGAHPVLAMLESPEYVLACAGHSQQVEDIRMQLVEELER